LSTRRQQPHRGAVGALVLPAWGLPRTLLCGL
jgi:hypothetical protein